MFSKLYTHFANFVKLELLFYPEKYANVNNFTCATWFAHHLD